MSRHVMSCHCILMTHFNFLQGLVMGILGPSQPYLAHMVGVGSKEINFAIDEYEARKDEGRLQDTCEKVLGILHTYKLAYKQRVIPQYGLPIQSTPTL